MAQRVPKFGNALLRIGIPALGLAILAALVAPMLYVRAPVGTGQYQPLEQPIAFDHNHHVAQSGIDCFFCHTDVRHSASAGIPATEICMGCHRQIWRESPILAPVRESYAQNRSIQWQRVNSLPMFVFFNHSIHINQGVGCTTCHGQISNMPQVYQKQPLTMGWCIDCHRDPIPNIRPRTEVTSAVWAPQQNRANETIRDRLAQNYQTRSLTHCSACHR